MVPFPQPAPAMVEGYGRAIEQQREDRRAGKAGLAAENPLEEGNDARHVRHHEGQPERRDEVKGEEPFQKGD